MLQGTKRVKRIRSTGGLPAVFTILPSRNPWMKEGWTLARWAWYGGLFFCRFAACLEHKIMMPGSIGGIFCRVSLSWCTALDFYFLILYSTERGVREKRLLSAGGLQAAFTILASKRPWMMEGRTVTRSVRYGGCFSTVFRRVWKSEWGFQETEQLYYTVVPCCGVPEC